MSTEVSTNTYESIVSKTLADVIDDFHVNAELSDGSTSSVPATYQIAEPGFRPFKAGKASGEEIQAELDQIIQEAEARNIDLGLDSAEAVHKLLLQMGLGIDCSNLAYRYLERIHCDLSLQPYSENVFRDSHEILRLMDEAVLRNKISWLPKDRSGQPRHASTSERSLLNSGSPISVAWISSVFGKQPEFITGAKHIGADAASVEVSVQEVLPGDLLLFRKAGSTALTHVAILELIEQTGDSTYAHFWHSWHTRRFSSGLRRDSVQIDADGTEWSHPSLGNPGRYSSYEFRRPNAIHEALAQTS